jgi:hypothetical protein
VKDNNKKKTIFLATMFGRTLPFSSRELAEKAIVSSIIYVYEKRSGTAKQLNHYPEFRQMVNREDFSSALSVWSEGVRQMRAGDVFIPEIKEVAIDQPMI